MQAYIHNWLYLKAAGAFIRPYHVPGILNTLVYTLYALVPTRYIYMRISLPRNPEHAVALAILISFVLRRLHQ